MLYRRDRASEVVAADGINGPAVEGEAPLEIQEDGNCGEFSEVAALGSYWASGLGNYRLGPSDEDGSRVLYHCFF